jgi:hypothetical protein
LIFSAQDLIEVGSIESRGVSQMRPDFKLKRTRKTLAAAERRTSEGGIRDPGSSDGLADF